jgi:hypothetical protein
VVPDYYPLSRDDLLYLLRRAQALRHPQGRASIQVRLHQGIVGQTCPRPWEPTHPVSRAMRSIDTLYQTYLHHAESTDLPALADALFLHLGQGEKETRNA